MIIFITGNISSGKTTVSKELLKILKGFKYLSLDDYRRKYNKNNSIDGEEKAQLKLIKDIQSTKKAIIDSTGTGKWFDEYIDATLDKDVEIIQLKTQKSTCQSRHNKRIKDGYKLPPFPYDIPISNGLEYVNNKLEYAYCNFKVNANKPLDEVINKIITKSKIIQEVKS